MPNELDADRYFTEALVMGTVEAIASWVATGPDAVHRLRQELTGERRVALPEGVSQRGFLDNLHLASHAVAAAFPDEFLDAFIDPKWDESPSVCAGFGAIRRPEVTARLIGMLKSDNPWLRVDAAVALRGHRHPELRAALTAALQDPEYLVAHHAAERLEELNHPWAGGTEPER